MGLSAITAILYDASGAQIGSYAYTSVAAGTWSRQSAGSFADAEATKGAANAAPATPEPLQPEPSAKLKLVLNEINSSPDDWVELMNTGTEALDNDPVGHKADVTPVPNGTTLEPGALYVFEQNKDFTFGLGKADKAAIYDAGGSIIVEYEWTTHANGVYARIPDGTGEFQDFATATKGKKNKVINPVVINEVQSNDPNGGPDWVELANPTAEDLVISGLVLKDNKDKDPYTIPKGTTIPANGFLVIYQDDGGAKGFAFGLGKGDSVRLFEGGEQITATTWPDGSHTSPTWGLYLDVNGSSYQNTLEATPGAANKFAGIPDVVAWSGSNEVHTFDTTPTFLEDSSGLDFADGKLYSVDNGTATFWVMNAAKNGTLTFASGFEQGKRVCFLKDADNAGAKGPDAEGITVNGSGMVYLASERDNSAKGVNYNTILMVNPNESGTRLVAQKQWDLTATLPQVSANMGIEAVEWVANGDVAGKLIDQYVLNKDETIVQIADIDAKLGGAMALDYDTYEDVLWVAADDGYGNRMARITLNGTSDPKVVHVQPAAGVNTSANNEGFAIAGAEYTVSGQRPVYRFCDGVTSGALTIGSMSCNYTASGSGAHHYYPSAAIDSPATGDSSHIPLMVMLTAASGTLLAAAAVCRYRCCKRPQGDRRAPTT